jgi:hypothetical protein
MEEETESSRLLDNKQKYHAIFLCYLNYSRPALGPRQAHLLIYEEISVNELGGI